VSGGTVAQGVPWPVDVASAPEPVTASAGPHIDSRERTAGAVYDRPLGGRVVEIQRCAVHDGPGIRTVVFLKGCPLRCVWCQNPESLNPREEIGHIAARCIGCEACVHACPQHAIRRADPRGIEMERVACVRCGSCVEECVADAMKWIGRDWTVSEVLEAVLRDREFYDQSGGGLTLSGGEPFLQHYFAGELLREAKQAGLHTVVETCGHFRWCDIESALRDVDLVYFDLKVIDDVKHRAYTGVSNHRILANARRLAASEASVVFRCPLVPGYTATTENLSALIRFLRDLGQDTVHLLPYHPFGESKLARVASPLRALGLDPLGHEIARGIADRFEAAGLRAVLGGS
jgi:pyruvate formate lyase activating enzyme